MVSDFLKKGKKISPKHFLLYNSCKSQYFQGNNQALLHFFQGQGQSRNFITDLTMKKNWVLFFLFLSFLFSPFGQIFAMGSSSSETPDIPIPVKNYQAEILDRSGTKLLGERVSLDGKVYIQGLIGKAEVNIPFEKLRGIKISSSVTKTDREYSKAEVFTKTGEKIEVLISSNAKIYGDSSFGKFGLYVRDLLQIDFKD